MKLLSFLLLILPTLASAAPAELVCEPDARIVFHSRWRWWKSSVDLNADFAWSLPWTGKEATVSGQDLRAERMRDLDSPEAAVGDELLSSVPAESKFAVFKPKSEGPNPLASVLYIDRALLEKGEQDGIVISQQLQQLEITAGKPASKVRIFHCRSR